MRKNWREKTAWLATMPWDEARTRLRREVAKRIDRVVYGAGLNPSARELKPSKKTGKSHSKEAVTSRGGSALSQAVGARRPYGRFFFTPGDIQPLLSLLRKRFPRECEETLEQAERICRHQFDLLGFEGLDYGKVIDWHLDPVNAKRSPRRPWYKIRTDESGEAGDPKIIREINRHQHLVTLAKAHLLRQDSRYLAELLDQWHGWQKDNPYPFGINWASGLEVAFRSLAWLWVGHLLSASPAAPKSFQHELMRGLAASAGHIERYFSIYSSGTHLLGEAVALFFIGTLCPRLRSAARWQELGWRVIVEQAATQVQAGGMHCEQSVYYHVYALDFFLHARILAACNQIPIPEPFDRTIERMLELLASISQAGSAPRFGDDDGGRVFDPRRNRREHMLDPLSTGAAIYQREDFKSASRGLKEEALWLLGPEGVRRFDALEVATAPAASTAFRDSGFYVMAGSEDAQREGIQGSHGRRTQLVIGARPQESGEHRHADALSLQLSVDGEEWLIDPGTFSYLSLGSGLGSAYEPESGRDRGAGRERFRGAVAHNTLLADGVSQSGLAEAPGSVSSPRTEVEQWITGWQFDLFLGKHHGCGRMTNLVAHRRWVFHLKPQFWLVRDVVEGTGEHELEIFWHFAPDFVPSYTSPGFTLTHTAKNDDAGMEKTGLAIVPPEGHGWSQEIRRGHVSPAYGVEEPAPVVRFQTSARMPTELAVVLQPVGPETGSPGRLRRDGSARVSLYRYQTDDALHLFFFSDDSRPWEFDGWKSDARFVYLSASTHDRFLRLALCAGSFLEIGDQRVLACDRPVEQCEVIANGRGAEIHCADPQASVEFKRANLDAALEAAAGFPLP